MLGSQGMKLSLSFADSDPLRPQPYSQSQTPMNCHEFAKTGSYIPHPYKPQHERNQIPYQSHGVEVAAYRSKPK